MKVAKLAKPTIAIGHYHRLLVCSDPRERDTGILNKKNTKSCQKSAKLLFYVFGNCSY
jgi:hypothetical protein